MDSRVMLGVFFQSGVKRVSLIVWSVDMAQISA